MKHGKHVVTTNKKMLQMVSFLNNKSEESNGAKMTANDAIHIQS